VQDIDNTETYALHADTMGNIVLATDTNGHEAGTYRYTPFGRLITATGAFKSRYLFSSKEYDEEVGLYYYGYRYYQPDRGRWLTRDPIGVRGGVNLYAFVRNRSVNLYDPFGLSNAPWVTLLFLGDEGWREFADRIELRIDEVPTSCAEAGRIKQAGVSRPPCSTLKQRLDMTDRHARQRLREFGNIVAEFTSGLMNTLRVLYWMHGYVPDDGSDAPTNLNEALMERILENIDRASARSYAYGLIRQSTWYHTAKTYAPITLDQLQLQRRLLDKYSDEYLEQCCCPVQ
jgi:RHS repeat-associated protein